MNHRRLYASLALSGAIAVLPPLADAGVGTYLAKKTGTAINAGASSFTGRYEFTPPGWAIPYVQTFFLREDDCLRIDVTKQDRDMEAVLVGPNGVAWRNDNRGGAGPAASRPLIEGVASSSGWHTLIVSGAMGTEASGNFTFKAGRYAQSNPNCADASLGARERADTK